MAYRKKTDYMVKTGGDHGRCRPLPCPHRPNLSTEAASSVCTLRRAARYRMSLILVTRAPPRTLITKTPLQDTSRGEEETEAGGTRREESALTISAQQCMFISNKRTAGAVTSRPRAPSVTCVTRSPAGSPRAARPSEVFFDGLDGAASCLRLVLSGTTTTTAPCGMPNRQHSPSRTNKANISQSSVVQKIPNEVAR